MALRIDDTTTATDVIDHLTDQAVRAVGEACADREMSQEEFVARVERVFTAAFAKFMDGLHKDNPNLHARFCDFLSAEQANV